MKGVEVVVLELPGASGALGTLGMRGVHCMLGMPQAPCTSGVRGTGGVPRKLRAIPGPCCWSGGGSLQRGGRINVRLKDKST
jgi:hypothetical protein